LVVVRSAKKKRDQISQSRGRIPYVVYAAHMDIDIANCETSMAIGFL
jgi:hypothetical protein